MRWYFGFFFVSGFCSILYELVWLRLAMARFSVTTALVSIVLSAFMVGLGLGSWAAGRYIGGNGAIGKRNGLRLYALAEMLIGVSALLVPYELSWGRLFLEKMASGTSLSTGLSYLLSGIWIALTLVPWCACMGATFPFAMSAIQERFPQQSPRSFSYLYLANVCGAMAGAVIPLLFIEKWGFAGTLRVGAMLNLALATSALLLTLGSTREPQTATPVNVSPAPKTQGAVERWPQYLLFATGLTSMGVEVVWVRLFTPFLGTVVYAFAAILGLYLGATYLGSWIYRFRKSRTDGLSNLLLAGLAFYVLVPLAACDTRFRIFPAGVRIVGLIPFSIIVGFITPMLLDRFSQGDPNRAGRGYAINIAGCVCGPLIAGFLLLPLLGERLALCAFALPWFVMALLYTSPTPSPDTVNLRPWMSWKFATVTVASLVLIFLTRDYENQFYPREVLRDHTATVIAAGTGFERNLIVNGIGITGLVPATKMMAHLPLAYLGRQPQNALVICFGMGTTHRAVLSWGIRSTAVELVPSVPRVFPYFYDNGAQLLRSPLSQVVIDDGRHYLERSSDQYDVITIDPPPPVEAAGSSLLYSKEFYELAKRHLRTGGILQQWFPQGSASDPTALVSVAKAIRESFPYVRVFHSVGGWGNHFLASMSPLTQTSGALLASRLPPSAVSDLLEFGPYHSAEEQLSSVTNSEFSIESLIARASGNVPALQDDRPVNEYYLLRSTQDPDYRRHIWERLLRALRKI
jgi:spermidine synthase